MPERSPALWVWRIWICGHWTFSCILWFLYLSWYVFPIRKYMDEETSIEVRCDIHPCNQKGWLEYCSILKIMFSNEFIPQEAVTFWVEKARMMPTVNESIDIAIQTQLTFMLSDFSLLWVHCVLSGYWSSWVFCRCSEMKVEFLSLSWCLSLIPIVFVSWTWLREAGIWCTDFYC